MDNCFSIRKIYCKIIKRPNFISIIKGEIMNPNIYLCYSQKDFDIAVDVCSELEQYGIEVWNDSRDDTAKYYTLDVAGATDYIELIVLLFSGNVNESDYVKKEIELAFTHQIPVIVLNLDGSPYQSELQFFLGNSHQIIVYDGIHNAVELLVEDISRISHNPDRPALFKPRIGIEGENKPKAVFLNKDNDFASSYVYLSYDDADLEFIESQIMQYEFMGVNFHHQNGPIIKGASLLVAFISEKSCKSSKIKNDIKRAVTRDVGILMIHLDDAEPDFGKMFENHYGSKFRNAIKYSIYKQEMDELTYIDKCDEIFQLFGVKK